MRGVPGGLPALVLGVSLALGSGSVFAQAAGAAAAAIAAPSAAAAAPEADEMHKNSPEASTVRGAIVFKTYCVLCHGAHAEGNGRAAKLYTPPPANLTRSPYNEQYWEMIIRGGGERMARSAFMPPWGSQLTDEQIADVVAFLKSIRK